MISKLWKWKHSGFGIDNGVRIEKDDAKGREAIAQPFKTELLLFDG